MRDSKTFFSAAALIVALVVSAVPASAQIGRIGGTIKDPNNQPLKGATVTAENPAASPSSFTATTDDKGRYSIIGLKSGQWKITASAPGFSPSSGGVNVRTVGAPMPPVDFVLAPGATGPAGALAGVNTKELQAEIQKAMDLANGQQYDAAIAAYQAILTKTPALTMINGQIAQVQRLQKKYDDAIASYQKVLAADPSNDKSKIEIGMTYLEKGDFANAEKSLHGSGQLDQREPRSLLQPRRGEVRKGRDRRGREVLPARRRHGCHVGQAALQDRPRQAAEGRHARRARDHAEGRRGRSDLGRSRAGQGADRAAEEGIGP